VRRCPITRLNTDVPQPPLRLHAPQVERRPRPYAEVIRFDDLVAAGSMAEAKKRGTVRMEGKTYVVHDGDIMNILFNV